MFRPVASGIHPLVRFLLLEHVVHVLNVIAADMGTPSPIPEPLVRRTLEKQQKPNTATTSKSPASPATGHLSPVVMENSPNVVKSPEQVESPLHSSEQPNANRTPAAIVEDPVEQEDDLDATQLQDDEPLSEILHSPAQEPALSEIMHSPAQETTDVDDDFAYSPSEGEQMLEENPGAGTRAEIEEETARIGEAVEAKRRQAALVEQAEIMDASQFGDAGAAVDAKAKSEQPQSIGGAESQWNIGVNELGNKCKSLIVPFSPGTDDCSLSVARSPEYRPRHEP